MLARYPDDARLLTLKAHALLQLQRANEALPILEQLVERRPRRCRAETGTRTRLCCSRQLRRGDSIIEEQLDTDSDGSLHMQLARAYSATGQRDKAAPLMAGAEELRKADDERRAIGLPDDHATEITIQSTKTNVPCAPNPVTWCALSSMVPERTHQPNVLRITREGHHGNSVQGEQ